MVPRDTPQTRPRYWQSVEESPSLAEQLALIPPGSKVLEIGPAAGHMTQLLCTRGCDVTAIEANPELGALASRFCTSLVCGDIERIDLTSTLGAERFDVILLGDVLEHLARPESVLHKLREYLTPTGFLVVSVPNIAHCDVRLALLDGKFDYQEQGILDCTHMRFFTLHTLKELFGDSRYAISNLVRVRVPFCQTMIPVEPSTVPVAVLRRLCHDPEAETYQFVFRARPTPKATSTQGVQHNCAGAAPGWTPDRVARRLALGYTSRGDALLRADPLSGHVARRMYYRAFVLHPQAQVVIRILFSLMPRPVRLLLRRIRSGVLRYPSARES